MSAERKRDAGDIAFRWWQAMQPTPERKQRGDRAALAKLRRCGTVAEALMEPAAITLFRELGGGRPEALPAVALLAVVLAHLRKDERGKPVARLLGPSQPDKPETALLSPLRFRRLLEAAPGDERLTAFRRMVGMTGGALPVRDLAESLLGWTDERRRRWTYDYWDAGRPTKPDGSEPEEPVA